MSVFSMVIPRVIAGLVVPLGLVLGGAVAAQVKRDRGWYLLSLVGLGRLAVFLGTLLAATLAGFLLGLAGVLPVPN